ncbi:gfo/Idh/MocA family oxidoreductase [Agromyces sp. CFH 90414]|uniref:Gfo/Idh/MocA family oxidoreductase n=1 Tax=Agromyces agglutinans TaxID=2662258 RepID=A0A6I2F7G3_9MICO|nr:gfo/Idh/MocA family oxidoreductase [Agromyces agglutinans]MRG60251.1 gfo/Idh/MocA family oxidoreductase [Agromyces agglutinans]
MTDAAPVRFGLIGVDSSHSVQFTTMLGDGRTGRVAGGTVVAAWKAPTVEDFPPSRDRNDWLAAELEALGMPLLDSPGAVAEASDALLIVASDVRTHPAHLRRLTRFGKPVFVDTRFAPTRREAVEMLEQATGDGCLVLAGSPKRFTPEFRAALGAAGGVERIDLDGPLPEQPHHPFLAWYGVHLVDLAVAAFGPGCETVEATGDRVTATWNDGRVATLRGDAEWTPITRGVIGTAAGEEAFEIEASAEMLAGLLESLISSCRTDTSNVPAAEILATVAIVEAAARSRELGEPVSVTA